jgi:FMN phosphatase YigB (HAD superfamily)
VAGAVSIIFGFERFYIGKKEKLLRKISWSEWERYNKEYKGKELSARLTLYSRWTDIDPEAVREKGDESLYRPYSKELWKGLEALRKSICEAKAKILQLITTEKGIARIKGGNALALTSGKEEK